MPALLPNLMYTLATNYRAACAGRMQDPEATMPEIMGFDPDTRRQIGWMIEAVPAESLAFVKDMYLVERLMCQIEVRINPLESSDGVFEENLLNESYRTIRARMRRLESAWNDNVTIVVNAPTSRGIEIVFRVTGFEDGPSRFT